MQPGFLLTATILTPFIELPSEFGRHERGPHMSVYSNWDLEISAEVVCGADADPWMPKARIVFRYFKGRVNELVAFSFGLPLQRTPRHTNVQVAARTQQYGRGSTSRISRGVIRAPPSELRRTPNSMTSARVSQVVFWVVFWKHPTAACIQILYRE
jgi:hypothetical protein